MLGFDTHVPLSETVPGEQQHSHPLTNHNITNEHIGHDLILPKEPSTTRIHFQNINGATVHYGGSWGIICEQWKEMDIDIAMAAELKLDTCQPKVLSKMREAARLSFGHKAYRFQATSTPVPCEHTFFKPGGVATIIVGPTTGRVLDSGSDVIGRWVWTRLRRVDGTAITIICTYQVVETDAKKAGPQTYASQLLAQYNKEHRPDPHKLRKHHSDDLVHFIQERQQLGDWIIVAGDFNESIGFNTSGLTRLCRECQLIDPVLDQHLRTDFATHQKGKTVIDYILVDEHVNQTVLRSGYEPFCANILSDHRGVFLDLSTNHLFGDTIRPLQPIQYRDISSKRIHQIEPYFKHKDTHLSDHHWYSQIDTLQAGMDEDIPDHHLAEKLYQRLLTACRYAGSRLQRYPPAPYSPDIVRMRNIYRLLKLAITQFTSKYDHSKEIDDTIDKLGHIGF
jgi:hypothetical protein